MRAAVAAALTLVAAGCAAPLGPGFTVERQSLKVDYLPAAQPDAHARVRASWRLKNTGTRPLESLEVQAPETERYGRTGLKASVDGREVATANTASGALNIVFEKPWAQNERLDVVIEYELGKQATYLGVALQPDALVLTGWDWYPALRAPKSALAKVTNEKPLDLTVCVPEGFLAHAGGSRRGKRKDAGALAYRFRMKKDAGRPFVVAGRFYEQQFRRENTTIVFWTIHSPWPQEQIAKVGARLADCVEAYEREFGLLPGDKVEEPYRVVVIPGWSTTLVSGFPLFLNPEFPRGAVILARDKMPDNSNNYELMMAAYGFSESWFETPEKTEFGATSVFQMTLMQYAARFVGAEAMGVAPERTAAVQQTLKGFDHYAGDPRSPKPRPLAAVAVHEKSGERLPALIRSELFFAALEDKCGEDAVRRAMRHLAETLRGENYGYTELRSALEQECGADLGATFRMWLYDTGIPADFRQRYETPKSPAVH